MYLQYDIASEGGDGEIPLESVSSLDEWVERLEVDDFVILLAHENCWVQTRCEDEGQYRLEYLDDRNNTIFESNPELVERNDVIRALSAFAQQTRYLREVDELGIAWVVSNLQPEVQVSPADAHTSPHESSPNNEVSSESSPHTNGYEFEEYVAVTLQNNGWTTRLTRKSGDQGLDVLAFDDRYRVAIQCKRYSSPVGNSAVQEVHAAADFVGAGHAVLVATSGFTASAQQLAEALGVLLVTEENLGDMRSYLAFVTPRPFRKNVDNLFQKQ